MTNKVRIAIIGAGAVSDYHHVPGIRLDQRCELVAVCDPNEELLNKRQKDWGPTRKTTDVDEIANDPNIDAVIIATPNFTHKPIALACINGGKHVMCEKPLGLNFTESAEMFRAARDKNLRHMTAFTYRFAPSMRYVRHLVKSGALGTPRHFRSQRFLDWPETSWGWRQYKNLAGAGDLFDMTIHRIDFEGQAWAAAGPAGRPTNSMAAARLKARAAEAAGTKESGLTSRFHQIRPHEACGVPPILRQASRSWVPVVGARR